MYPTNLIYTREKDRYRRGRRGNMGGGEVEIVAGGRREIEWGRGRPGGRGEREREV